MAMRPMPAQDEYAFREYVAKLLAAKNSPFAVSGRIPVDSSHLSLFFRSKVFHDHLVDGCSSEG